MGKHGPCCHCGVTSTPLWRNGPPEKPILCNACGSRWRTKGSLVNYTPLHARGEPNEYEDYKIPKIKIMTIKPQEIKVLKRKQIHENKVIIKNDPDYKYSLLKTLDEETSNRSSSGSAISNVSESCVQYGSVDVSELTGPSQPVVWDQMVPSKKRTCIIRSKQSQLEKLTKDLNTILQEQQLSHISASSEEDLLLESDRSMVSVEIGHGSVLIRHPSTIAHEDESEASSISVENKVNNRDKDEHKKLPILENHNSPLCYIDLKEIINYQVFSNQMTNEEQQQLLQLLPDLDISTLPLSLQSMFTSPKLEEDLFSFQKLLSEGVFDFSFSGVKAEDYQKLKNLVLSSSKKSTWVEQYSLLKDKEAKSSNKGHVSREGAHDSSPNVKRSCNGHFRIGSGTKTTKKSLDFNNFIENGGSFFPIMEKFQFMSGNSEQDLLLDVPMNNSFPEAEFFYQNAPSNSVVYPRLTDPNKAF